MVDAKESGAPLVFHTLMIKLQEVLFKDQMPEDMYGIMYGSLILQTSSYVQPIQERKAFGLRSRWH